MTVSLPDTGDGSRRQRRAEKRRPQRRWGVRGLAALVAAGVLGTSSWLLQGIVDDDSSRPVAPLGPDDVVADGPGPALVVLADGGGEVYGLTIFVSETSSIVHVPPGVLVEVPSLGLASLAEAAAEGGEDLVQQSLENLLGVRMDLARLGPAEVEALVNEVDPFGVEVVEPVEQRVASGRVDVVIPSGSFTIRPENVVGFLSTLGDDTGLERLVRHQLFWTAYLAADGSGGGVDAIEALADADVRHRVLPVEAVSGLDGGEELYRVVTEDLDELITRVLPNEARAGGERIRVRILNGAGAPGIAQDVQPLLVDIGAQVTLSGNADRFDYATTQIVYYDDDDLDAARAVASAIGVGEVVKSLNELAVVDVTVVVGADFLAAHPEDS